MNQQGPIQTTEWSDIQYKFGNKVGKYADPELEQKILEQRLKQTGIALHRLCSGPAWRDFGGDGGTSRGPDTEAGVGVPNP